MRKNMRFSDCYHSLVRSSSFGMHLCGFVALKWGSSSLPPPRYITREPEVQKFAGSGCYGVTSWYSACGFTPTAFQ